MTQPETPSVSGGSDRHTGEKHDLENVEHAVPAESTGDSGNVLRTLDGSEVVMTWKTWIVIFILSSTFGLSFWPVPTTGAMQAQLVVWFGGDPALVGWYTPAYTTANAIGFLLAGTNSDLFGRRLFLIFGNVVCCVGFIVTATAHGSEQFIAGLAITGFGGGFCQMAMCAIPELMPNKYRHIGICLSDGFVFVIVVIGPVIGKYVIDDNATTWKYVYWAGFIAQVFSLAGIVALYYPPKHPRGVPWKDAVRGLDYVGALLVVPGVCLTLVGIINTQSKKSTDVLVLAPMCTGFGVLILFGIWETVSGVKYPLCPPHVFRYTKGREFTAPFILAFIVTMFYYSINVIYPTMQAAFYIDATTPRSQQLLLTLPSNLGLVFGACCLMAFGNLCGHWKLTLIASWTGMTIFGGLMALVTPYNKGLMIAFTFLMQSFFGWAQYESNAFSQLGVPQEELGIAGGLTGTARYAGGSLATAIYMSVLTNTQKTRAAATLPQAAIAAGLDPQSAQQLLAAFPLGAAAISAVPGVNATILEAASTAYKWSYAHGLKITALSSLSFAGLGLICCIICLDIGDKMNNKTEIFLENDVYHDKNKYH
ncbi:Fungal trichothecene efflux pump [Niveomyces insectorum RCEF 264]|uniref:Fungal trichothecene efflux pump n=1 Tax=Niveomyces insectorum RCEF 264 TaxID=1081102 RepID=A0A167WA02_9HYPO|nr:Fungal trichothecene efflux pump [Niveomyces insectorum RCEF 264]